MTYQAPSVRASGKTITDLQTLGLNGILEAIITANVAATAAPTAAPTAAATGGGSSGGLLAAGTYLLTFTETNGVGETTASPESATLTVGSTNIPRVTFPTLKTGNTARNLYATPVNGTTGQEVLYASGITTTTYDMAVAAPGGVAAPTTNTTGLTTTQVNIARRVFTQSKIMSDLSIFVTLFFQGSPTSTADVLTRLTQIAAATHVIQSFVDEVGTLIVANPGTLHTRTNGAGNLETYRTVP